MRRPDGVVPGLPLSCQRKAEQMLTDLDAGHRVAVDAVAALARELARASAVFGERAALQEQYNPPIEPWRKPWHQALADCCSELRHCLLSRVATGRDGH